MSHLARNLNRTVVAAEHREMAATQGQPRVEVAATAWRPTAELAIAEWREAGRKLAAIARGSAWWLGDWLNYGERAYGEKYAEAIAITGLEVGTLMDYAWVAGAFEISRRREGLSFSHHREVAGCPRELADELLDAAQEASWSRNRIRAEVKKRQGVDVGGGHADKTSLPAVPPAVDVSAGPPPPRATLEVELRMPVGSAAEGRRQLELRLRVLRERADELGLVVA